MDELTKLLKNVKKGNKKLGKTVWSGPCSNDVNGGCTQGLLSKFLSCRERFRLLVVEGLKAEEGFSSKMEFGNMWHACEEAFAVSGNPIVNNPVVSPPWLTALTNYSKNLAKKHPLQRDQVQHWYGVCQMMFPLYVKHWREHQDVKDRFPLLQEEVFCVPYELPSGRTVYMRGKFDSVDLIGKGKNEAVFLQENKTKQRIDEQKIKRQLTMDMQAMFYLVALDEMAPADLGIAVRTAEIAADIEKYRPQGIRYNVIRRSEHRVGKKETEKDFLERLKGIIEGSPQEWFMRWKVEVSPQDIAKFRLEFLDPILEQLCDWWEWVSYANDRGLSPFDRGELYRAGIHWRHPFGAENAVDGGWGSDLDNYMDTGSDIGLRRITNLFPELGEV